MRRKRRRFFRDDVLAPWVTLGVIIVFWWLSAMAIGRERWAAAVTSNTMAHTTGAAANSSVNERLASIRGVDANTAHTHTLSLSLRYFGWSLTWITEPTICRLPSG